MVASAEDVVEAEERPVHQGCMAGFLHLFDRPHIRRLHHTPRRLLSSSSGSATPSERSMQLDRSSLDATPPPAAPRSSLQLPPLDLKDADGHAAPPSWRLPRLSLDSRSVVDGRGKYRPRDIRAPPSPPSSSDDRRSPSVVARLMGLDALPHGQEGDGGGHTARELRRSASERVPRGDPSRFRFVDPAFFERPAAATETAVRRMPDPAAVGPRWGGVQRRASRFDAREVFPEPAKDPAAAHGGEIALYGEIERRLRKRGIAEPARDLETLKQVLEALQLKGLLRHAQPPVGTPPAIVVMRPSSHRAPQPPAPARLMTPPARRLRVDVDRAGRRPRSPDASPARSPASPHRRVSPAQSPKQHQPQPLWKPSTMDARSRIARRAASQSNGRVLLFPDEEASTPTFSDGGSSGETSSRWDFEPALGVETSGKLERCGKLLSSIHAFTGGDAAAGCDQQPSPVSVLDAASFLADEDSPPSSSGSKRAIDFNVVRRPRKAATAVSSDPEDDEWALGACPTPDYAYVAELVRLLLHRTRDPGDAYRIAERRRAGTDGGDTRQRRRLLCGAVAEAPERQRSACPWDPAAWLRGGELVAHVWTEVREPVSAAAAEQEDVTCGLIRRDLVAADGAWASTLLPQARRPGAEVADAVLHVERLVFKDLVAYTIRELADADRFVPRRRLVF